MFIESLTPDQLVHFAELLLLAAFAGGVLGATLMPVIECVLGGLFDASARLIRGPGARVRDLQRSRYMHLTAARTARRELRKMHG